MPSLRRRLRSIALVEQLGPGLITGAADDDPSGIATYSQAGARFGLGLIWTLLLTYVAVVFMVKLDCGEVGRALIWPQARLSREAVMMIVAIFGTTISPYLFFWQAAQEVEEIDRKESRKPLTEAPTQARKAF